MSNVVLSADDAILVGKISGVFGTRGWVKVFAYTRPRAQIFTYQDWYLGTPPKAKLYRVRDTKPQGNSLVAQLEGVNDRDQALVLNQQKIHIARSELPPIGDREFYWADLIGLDVVNREGVALGQIKRMLETGANDVMEVVGERTRLIPFVLDTFIDEVDLSGRRLLVNWHPDD